MLWQGQPITLSFGPPGGWGSEGWGVRALAGAAPEATGHSPSLPGLIPPDTGVPESLPTCTPVPEMERHAAVACSGDRAFSHRKAAGGRRAREALVNLIPGFSSPHCCVPG